MMAFSSDGVAEGERGEEDRDCQNTGTSVAVSASTADCSAVTVASSSSCDFFFCLLRPPLGDLNFFLRELLRERSSVDRFNVVHGEVFSLSHRNSSTRTTSSSSAGCTPLVNFTTSVPLSSAPIIKIKKLDSKIFNFAQKSNMSEFKSKSWYGLQEQR